MNAESRKYYDVGEKREYPEWCSWLGKVSGLDILFNGIMSVLCVEIPSGLIQISQWIKVYSYQLVNL
jgi:hypothetical protein